MAARLYSMQQQTHPNLILQRDQAPKGTQIQFIYKKEAFHINLGNTSTVLIRRTVCG